MSDVTIYHNPRCSKSRQTLALLQARGLTPEIVEYLRTPPDVATLERLLAALGLEPEQLVRKGEPRYAELGLDQRRPSRAEWLDLLAANPVLIERPIVVRGRRARLGRPPEQVLDLL
jgi:arsenate reductase (glutaredoxin)